MVERRLKLGLKEIKHLYVDVRLSTNEIAGLMGCDNLTIIRRLKEIGVKIRNRSERQKNFLSRHPEAKEASKEMIKYALTPKAIKKSALSRKKYMQKFLAEHPEIGKEWANRLNTKEAIKKRAETQKQFYAEHPEKRREMHSPKSRKKAGAGIKKYRAEHPEEAEAMNKRLHSPEVRRKAMKSRMKRPNKPESRLIKLFEQHYPILQYNHEARSVGGRFPDFISNNGDKVVAEMLGITFHNPEKAWFPVRYKRTEKGTLEHYAKYGYRCLTIWDYELKNEDKVIEKINEWY